MARYPNGGIPAYLLIEVGPYHWMTAPTAARWRALVADVLKNEGVTLRITPGKNAYRDRPGQVFARNAACARGRCNDAAVPGASSHGGEYQGRDSLAIDVDNWAVLGKAKFYAYCRKHGFEPGFFDWEPWHIIDWNPWVMPAGASTSKPSGNTTPDPIIEEDDMLFLYVDKHTSNKPAWVLINLRTGKEISLVNDKSKVQQDRANTWARVWGAARAVGRQDYLNALDALKKTS